MVDSPDTSLDMQRIHYQILMAKSPTERLMMACEQSDSIKQLIEEVIQQQHPEYTVGELKAAVFSRYYQQDFPPQALETITCAIKLYFDKQ